MGHLSSLKRVLIGTACAFSLTSISAAAQSVQPSTSGGTETVVVTAQKREELMKDVPISIEAIGAVELQKRQINGIDDLSANVPGLAMRSDGNTRTIEIRGVSNAAGNYSLVGVYLDEADVTGGTQTQLDLNTYDLKRVEVLRGPQGTLYGEGSAGGTIRLIANDPELDRFAFSSSASALFTQGGAPGQRLNSMVNLPISDTIGLRIAGTFDHEGGWIDQSAANRTDVNDQNMVDVRAKLLIQPSADFKITAMAEIHRNERGFNYGEDPSGNFTQVLQLTTTPRTSDDFDILNGTVSYKFANVELLSSTTYIDTSKTERNLGYYYPSLPTAQPSPLSTAYLQNPVLLHQPSLGEEFRLSSIGDSAFHWTAGFFYRWYRGTISNSLFFGAPSSTLAQAGTFLYTSNIVSETKSIFGDASYDISDRLTLGVGLRYFIDDQANETSSTSRPTAAFFSLDPRFYAKYKLNDGINLYASASKGFRSGGFNALSQPNYGPESVWTYELGTKTELFDSRLTANLAAFFSSYSNYQIQGTLAPPSPPINIQSNGGDAEIKGIEWDLRWRSDDWTLGLNGSYLDAKITAVRVTGAPKAVGDRLDYVPDYTLTASVERDFNFYGKDAYARLDYSAQGREINQNRTFPPGDGQSDLLNILSFTAGVQINENLALSAYVKNFTNDRGYVDPLSTEDQGSRAIPRMFGLQATTRF